MEDIQAVWNTASCYIPTEEKRSKWWQRISTSISSASSSGKYFDQEFFRQKLNFVEEYSDKLTCKKSVVIALLLQYLHYEPKLHGLNEEKTLEYFAEFLQDNLETNGLLSEQNQQILDNVEKLLITAIANSAGIFLHCNAFGDLDEHYFLDIDIAILGSKSEEYFKYTQIIREEYASFSDEQYGKLRKRALKPTLPSSQGAYTENIWSPSM
ncbi:uncharacterized protein LOC136032628 isoform X2 [Artemia franciscana]|uniref:uncharacterized protein LOC136032628 isoform X2 n=1 Tax=Artemia franciscana TaxID=6661 RepID=UPI0032DAD905